MACVFEGADRNGTLARRALAWGLPPSAVPGSSSTLHEPKLDCEAASSSSPSPPLGPPPPRLPLRRLETDRDPRADPPKRPRPTTWARSGQVNG